MVYLLCFVPVSLRSQLTPPKYWKFYWNFHKPPQQSSNRTCNPSQAYTFPQVCITLWKHGCVASFTKNLDYKQISTNRNTTELVIGQSWSFFYWQSWCSEKFLSQVFLNLLFPIKDIRHSPLFNPKWKRKKKVLLFRWLDIILATCYFPYKLYCLFA